MQPVGATIAPTTFTSLGTATGSAGGADNIEFIGTLFDDNGVNWIEFGGVRATSVTVVSGTSTTADTPAHAIGTVDVTLKPSYGPPITLVGAFEYT